MTPTLTGFNPSSALFAVPTPVTVTGTNFEAGMSVVFGSESPTPVNVTPTSFDVTVGPQSIGPANVQVTRLNGEKISRELLTVVGHAGMRCQRQVRFEAAYTKQSVQVIRECHVPPPAHYARGVNAVRGRVPQRCGVNGHAGLGGQLQ